MNLFDSFFPDAIADSTYTVDFERLYSKGYRGLIFDIDNTLVEHNAPADERAIAFFDRLHSLGFKSVLLSNNRKGRIVPFAEQVNSMYICNANKPSVKGYLKAMEMMGTDRSNTLFVGDQLFTDVWGANRSGIKTILVGQIAKKEEIQIILKRFMENIVFHFYKKSPKYNVIDGNGEICI